MDIHPESRLGKVALQGTLPPEDATRLALAALGRAGAEKVEALLMDLCAASLTRPMSVIECHHAGECLARAGPRLLKVAFVARTECLRACSFIFTVAASRGLRARAFEHEADALAWLAAA